MKLKQRETGRTGVMRACEDLLTAEGIWWRRWNVGAVKIGKRFFRFGQKGDADILAAPVMRVKWLHSCGQMIHDSFVTLLWIETKPTGGKPTAEQLAFADEVRARGHYHLFVDDVTQLDRWLKENRAR